MPTLAKVGLGEMSDNLASESVTLWPRSDFDQGTPYF